MKKIVLLFALLVSVCQIAYSQDEPKVVVFNQSEKTEVNNTAKNLVKLSLLEPLLEILVCIMKEYLERTFLQSLDWE